MRKTVSSSVDSVVRCGHSSLTRLPDSRGLSTDRAMASMLSNGSLSSVSPNGVKRSQSPKSQLEQKTTVSKRPLDRSVLRLSSKPLRFRLSKPHSSFKLLLTSLRPRTTSNMSRSNVVFCKLSASSRKRISAASSPNKSVSNLMLLAGFFTVIDVAFAINLRNVRADAANSWRLAGVGFFSMPTIHSWP